MKILALLAFLVPIVVISLSPAYAGFSLKDGSSSTVTVNPAVKTKALTISNEYFVPDQIKQKYETVLPASDVASKPIADILPVKDIEALPLPAAPNNNPQSIIVQDVPKNEVALPVARIETWRARKGENLKTVLQRWSQRVGTDFTWTGSNSPKLKKEFSYVGNFGDAVNKLMSRPEFTGMNMKFDAQDQKEIADEIVPRSPPPVSSSIGPKTSWYALEGTSLQAALAAWVEQEDIRLIWNLSGNYAVKKTVSASGNFEDVLYELLSQYDNDQNRPVGRLYRDPATGDRVLVIDRDTAAQ